MELSKMLKMHAEHTQKNQSLLRNNLDFPQRSGSQEKKNA